MEKGKLFVVSGPSGAGKSTITKIIVQNMNNLELTVSATTRKPRKGEIAGIDYYFITMEEFQKNINEENFIEYALVHGNYYGTLKNEVENRLKVGKNVILEIDVQGAEQIKNKFPEAVLVFIKTDTKEELEKRLRNRATDDEEIIRKRIENSFKELEYEKMYRFTVVNKELDKAVKELLNIINTEGSL